MEAARRLGLGVRAAAVIAVLMSVLPAGRMLPTKVTPDVNVKVVDPATVDQPHRTRFHFQPQKNWMNGMHMYIYTPLTLNYVSFFNSA